MAKWPDPLYGMIERIEIKYAYAFAAFNTYGSATQREFIFFSRKRTRCMPKLYCILVMHTHANKRTLHTHALCEKLE